ncbi:MAG TPA: hypothetical protein PK765_01545 [bacterium]|nr:hypothetical protein [bacterium]
MFLSLMSILLVVSLSLNAVLVLLLLHSQFSPKSTLAEQVAHLRQVNVSTWNELEQIRQASK